MMMRCDSERRRERSEAREAEDRIGPDDGTRDWSLGVPGPGGVFDGFLEMQKVL